ncbi:hypothetical protein [Bradyrhizobium sp.]
MLEQFSPIGIFILGCVTGPVLLFAVFQLIKQVVIRLPGFIEH